jgi:hypothetical protein
MFRNWVLAGIVSAVTATGLAAFPFPPRMPVRPAPAPIEGLWFFRGDRFQPASVRSIPTPQGPQLLFTNERGSPAMGWFMPDGRRVFVPAWNTTATVRGPILRWANGDFWSR